MLVQALVDLDSDTMHVFVQRYAEDPDGFASSAAQRDHGPDRRRRDLPPYVVDLLRDWSETLGP